MVALLGCGLGAKPEPVSVEAQQLGDSECVVCGMIESERPSPRLQVVYRDGSHDFLCGLEDARALLAAPTPKGAPAAIWVENVPADFDWREYDTQPLAWTDATKAYYVFGAERPLVMGVPVLSYSSLELATSVADKFNTIPVSWADLMATPPTEVPKQSVKE